jgi:pimeloyl-ACP methyl ester carboxylesterase
MMTGVAARQTKTPTAWAQASVLNTIWAGCAVAVPLVIVANIAVEAVPHVRGLGFFPQIRYALLTPACWIGAIGVAFLYTFLKDRVDRPRWTLSGLLFALALVILLLTRIAGPKGLAMAGAPAALCIAALLALLVPRFVERPRRIVSMIATIVFGTLEIAGAVAALASEHVAPPGPDGMAFNIPRSMFDADQKFIDLRSGARIHYVDVGTGPTLLFLHGNPGWSFQWRDLINGLHGSFRCVALDYPGFGMSSAPPGYGFTPREQSRVVEEFVDRLGLHDITLVMQDWGGPIGIGLAERRPELIRRLILGNSWAWPTSPKEPRGEFSTLVGGPIGEFVQMNFNGALVLRKQEIARKLSENVGEVYMDPFRALDRRGVAVFYPGQILAASDYLAELEAEISRIEDKRALIFWGMKDPGIPPPDLRRMERILPSHKTIELPDAGHFFFEDAAQRVIEEITIFVSSK